MKDVRIFELDFSEFFEFLNKFQSHRLKALNFIDFAWIITFHRFLDFLKCILHFHRNCFGIPRIVSHLL